MCPCYAALAETFEAETMTKNQAKKRFLALMKPYWLKDLKESRGPKLSRKQHIAKHGDDDWYEASMEDWDWWDSHVKTVQTGNYGDAETGGDTILRESLPHSYWAFINYLPIEWKGSEKYEDDPYETMYLDIDYCIYKREVPWSQWSAADKRKIRKLENDLEYVKENGSLIDNYINVVYRRDVIDANFDDFVKTFKIFPQFKKLLGVLKISLIMVNHFINLIFFGDILFSYCLKNSLVSVKTPIHSCGDF